MKYYLFTLLTLLCILPLSAESLVVSVAGDIMMGTTFPKERLPRNEGRDLFSHVQAVFRMSHLSLANLEGTLTEADSTDKADKPNNYAFRTPPSWAPRLKEAGFDFLSMANNHAFDFGIEGVRNTEGALLQQGIHYAGIRGRRSSTVIVRNGVRYGIAAFGHNGYTMQHTDSALVDHTLRELRKRCDIMIVSFHGGAEGVAAARLPYEREEYLKENRGELRKFAHQCVDLGADLVYGHGPHVVRAVELYKGRFIAYSLGNFCTPYGININGVSGLAPVITVKMRRDGTFINARIFAFRQQYGVGPRRDPTHAVVKEIRRLTLLDCPRTPLTISDDGVIRRK